MRKLLLMAVAVCCSAPTFAQTDVQPVVGGYEGNLYVNVGSADYLENNDLRMYAKVFVNTSEDATGKVDFSLPNFSFVGMKLGDIFLPTIGLNAQNGVYTFGENPEVRLTFKLSETNSILADAKLDEALSYVKGDSIVAYIPVQWVQSETQKMPIAVLFKGVRVNPYALSNYNFNDAMRWEQSRPWDSTHGYFDWTTLEDNDEYWEQSKWQMEDYTTPDAWCISHVMGMNGIGATVVGAKELTNGDEENPDYAVRLTNTPNPFMPTQVVPGYMTLGTSFASASVSDLGKADGGTFGGVAFTGKPDAIQFDYSRSHTQAGDTLYAAEVINSEEPATVVAYLWKGQYKQEAVPGETNFADPSTVTMYGRERNILDIKTTTGGAATKSDDAACIAKVVKSITGNVEGKLETMVVPLDYGKYAGTDVQPDSLNIIFAASDYFGQRSKVGAGNALVVDNVKLLYYHDIKDASYNGEGFEFGPSHAADFSTEAYVPANLQFTKVGQGATVEQSYNDETGVLTITVKGQDVRFNPESVTVYTIQFDAVKTAIAGVKADAAAEVAPAVYGIDGRRLAAPVKGANIIGGKKVIK
ncbi:calycin-like domain-containing protein [Prevotellamassilia timonensis]|uniref:calycin-like domain-containing protein n=1 Tax=Prevotellamassilia timonensis TaxID=1852370 RepID=UPI0009F4986B|nr:calycin-like domain-containing protein [Prevotellamassilia timonensis]